MKKLIKELIPRDEPYNGEVSEKTFLSAIKGCKKLNLKDLFISKEIQKDILDNQDEYDQENETIIIKGYFETNMKNSTNKSQNKLDYIIKKMDQMTIEMNQIKENTSQEKIEMIVEKVLDKKVNPRLDNIKNRLMQVEKDVKNIDNRLTQVEKDVKNIDNRLTQVEKDVKDIKSCPTIDKELKVKNIN